MEEDLGFYFIPTDQELIVDYLLQRVAGLPLPSDVISDASVFSTPPWELLAGRVEAYFFSEQKPLGSSRSSRKMKSGTWKKESTSKEETAFLDSGAVVRWKKSLFSFHPTGCDCSSGFVMRERAEKVSVLDREDLPKMLH
ncbi:NAC domain-containing protein 41-like [Typha latifolia]|uniref:NAC domain-containing protein 41-like n=1 Tax=Typha latifolia TaxID=4733 RepID=UPI003C2BACBB